MSNPKKFQACGAAPPKSSKWHKKSLNFLSFGDTLSPQGVGGSLKNFQISKSAKNDPKIDNWTSNDPNLVKIAQNSEKNDHTFQKLTLRGDFFIQKIIQKQLNSTGWIWTKFVFWKGSKALKTHFWRQNQYFIFLEKIKMTWLDQNQKWKCKRLNYNSSGPVKGQRQTTGQKRQNFIKFCRFL